MRIYRIADGRHPLWDGTGALLHGGRWNSPGRPAIYACASYAGAMLEVLVHARIGKLPRTHRVVSADLPDDLGIDRIDGAMLRPGWDAAESSIAREIGDQWLASLHTAVLMVPSVVAREEYNVVVNPMHPDAARIQVGPPRPVIWDTRLFPAG